MRRVDENMRRKSIHHLGGGVKIVRKQEREREREREKKKKKKEGKRMKRKKRLKNKKKSNWQLFFLCNLAETRQRRGRNLMAHWRKPDGALAGT